MKYTVTYLVCDRCPGPPRKRRPAIISRALTNGKLRADDPTLDLCRQHDRAVVNVFRPRRVEGRPPAGTRKRGTGKRQVNPASALWVARRAKVLAAVRAHKVTNGVQLAKRLRWRRTMVTMTLRQLQAAKQVVKRSDGRYTTWELVK